MGVFYPTEALELIYKLGICGCGCPDLTYKAIQQMLEAAEKRECLIYDGDEAGPYLYFMAYTLDNKGFINHGISVRWARLEEKGKKLLEALREYEKYNYDHDAIMENTPAYFWEKRGVDNDAK